MRKVNFLLRPFYLMPLGLVEHANVVSMRNKKPPALRVGDKII